MTMSDVSLTRDRPTAYTYGDNAEESSMPRPESPQPIQRRGSMSEYEQQQRRASIKAIMADTSIPPVERRRSIQFLMDGRRNSMGSSSAHSTGTGYAPPSAGYAAPAPPQVPFEQYGLQPPAGQQPAQPQHGVQQPQAQYGAQQPGQQMQHGIQQPQYNMQQPNQMHQEPAQMLGEEAAPPHVPQPSGPVRRSSMITYSSGGMGAPANPPHGYAAHLCHPAQAAANEPSKRAEESRPTCPHYERKCTIISPCCGAAFGCRICHDDCPVLPPPVLSHERHDTEHGGSGRRKYQRSSSMPTSFTNADEPQHHTIDRFAIKEVICRACYTRQSSKTNHCINCNIQFGDYHCSVCNLWMSNEEKPYHCPDCGFCRVGGADAFRHCNDCGMCIDKLLFDEHNCKVGKYMSNCPVCQEDLFSSRSASHEMPCGHAIHWHCFRELASHDSRCPVCKKTAETHERMAPTWNAMAMGIALQPVPPELSKVVTIACNDCERSQANRAWHFLGVQCKLCTSFNTVVEQVTMTGPEAHAFLQTADPPATQTDFGTASNADTPVAHAPPRHSESAPVGGMAAPGEMEVDFPSQDQFEFE